MLGFAENLKDFRDAYLIRVGPEAGAYGDPWLYVCTLVSYDGETGVLMGFKSDGNFTPAAVTAAVRVALGLGYKKIMLERKGKRGSRWIDLTRKSGVTPP